MSSQANPFLSIHPSTYFQDNIERYIPAMFKTGEFDGCEAFFQTIVAPFLDEIYQRFIELPWLADIDHCPTKFLQLLAGNINTLTLEDTFNETQAIEFRRRELGKMVDLFKIRGVSDSFLRILKYLGSDDYGLIIPRRNLMILGVTPIGGAPGGELSDVQERLAPQYFDISSLADGIYDGDGNLLGSRVSYALSVLIVRSNVKLFWNLHEVPIQHEHTDGILERSFFFDRSNGTLTTNFIPLIGDQVIVEVVGDPRWRESYRMVDSRYWRPGTEEVYSDQNPMLRFDALMDRRPVGTQLYFAWLIKFFWTKCFPFPPTIDYHRRGYEGVLPPHQLATWNAMLDCNTPDPWFFQITSAYGYEGVWESVPRERQSRQSAFEASMCETAPRNLALSEDRQEPARSFLSTSDSILYGAPSELRITGDLSIGMWIQLPSNAQGNLIHFGSGGALNSMTAWPYFLSIVGSSNAWNFILGHDTASANINNSSSPFPALLSNDVWYYVGFSRNVTARTYTFYVGDGSSITQIGVFSYSANPPSTAGTSGSVCMVSSSDYRSDLGLLHLVGLVEQHYVANVDWSSDDHQNTMLGTPPPSGLQLSVAMGTTPETDVSPNGITGTVSGTTLVPGRHVPLNPRVYGLRKPHRQE